MVALTSTAEKQQTSALQVYPNPVNDVITFSSTVSFTTEALVEIIDLDGKVLWARKGVPGKIQMSPFAPGFYCLRVSDGNAVYTGKILVQR